MKKYLSFALPVLILFSLASAFFYKSEAFFSFYDPAYWEERYLESNWVKGWESSNPIGDAELYSYSGWRLIHGEDPTIVNPETPPLGKYFIGASILLFKNQNWPSLFWASLLLLITYFISQEVMGKSWLKYVPVLLLSLDGLFRDNIGTSLLDLPFAFFTAAAFYCLIKGRENPRFYPLVALSLAAVAATKTYLVGFALVGVIVVYLLFLLIFFRFKDLVWFALSLPIFALFYLANYVAFFLNGQNLIDFKVHLFWVRHFSRVQVPDYPPFEILRIVFLGKWKTWWAGSGIVSVPVWNPLWTISSTISLPTLYWFIKERNLKILILVMWLVSFLVMYSYGVPYPRYVLPILPVMYIILVFASNKIHNLWLNTKP